MKRTLVIILAFVAFMVGSFIWFVATWDPSKEDSITEFITGTDNDPIA